LHHGHDVFNGLAARHHAIAPFGAPKVFGDKMFRHTSKLDEKWPERIVL
jgi:hypothetical protein